MTPLRQAILAKVVHARAVLLESGLRRESGFAALEWQKGYVKALEEVLELEGLSLRRHRRRSTAIPAGVARISPAEGDPEQTRQSTIVDLSPGGCRLATPMEVSAGECIALTFTLPESSTVVAVRGWVRRAQRVNGEFRMGVEFKTLPESILEVLQSFCA